MAAGKRWGLLPLKYQSTAKFQQLQKSYLGTLLKKKNPTQKPVLSSTLPELYCYYYPSPSFKSIWHPSLQAAVIL